MSPISLLADIDPVFIEVAKALYGDEVDPRELWDVSKNMDSADVHVPRTLKVKKKDDPHSNAARALVLGGAAEGLGTYRAGQKAAIAVTKPAVKTAAGVTGKLKALGSAGHRDVGEFGLQAANLGIGLIAARKLSQNAKKQGVGKAMKMPKANFLRPVKHVLSEPDAAKFTTAMAGASKVGGRIGAGVALGTGALIGHHVGRKAGLRSTVAKGMFVPKPPVAGVRPINSGGAGAGLGRHGRSLTQATPPPQLQPVAKPLPKKIIDNTGAMGKSLTWTGRISKIDDEKRTVFGWCSLTKVDGEDVVDLQNDRIHIDEVEKSAYRYVLESRKGGDMHRRVSKGSEPFHTADLIESFVVTPEKLEQMGLRPDALPLGWWIGMKVNNEQQWADVKAGRRTGFSIHGTGSRTEVAA